MNNSFIRATLLILHAILNFAVVTYLLNFDITGKWVYFLGFIVLLLLLAYFFILHVVSFIYFVKTKTK